MTITPATTAVTIPPATTAPALEVLASGPLATLQDLGRPGLAHLGVSRSGAADRRSHLLANRLVGNPPDAATVEVTFGGFAARVHGAAVDITVTGADAAVAIDGIPFGANSVRRVRAGQLITFAAPAAGVRSYLAVRGGFRIAPVLGSCSYDTLARLGPPPLRRGDVLPIGSPAAAMPGVDQAPVAAVTGGEVVLRVVPGPRLDFFADPNVLVRTRWSVAGDSDRVGVRLTGATVPHHRPGRELPSEGMLRGAIQVPPGGGPVILGPDHPVTGGYPVIGVVRDDDLDLGAQVRPGQPVRLRWSRGTPDRPAGNVG